MSRFLHFVHDAPAQQLQGWHRQVMRQGNLQGHQQGFLFTILSQPSNMHAKATASLQILPECALTCATSSRSSWSIWEGETPSLARITLRERWEDASVKQMSAHTSAPSPFRANAADGMRPVALAQRSPTGSGATAYSGTPRILHIAQAGQHDAVLCP